MTVWHLSNSDKDPSGIKLCWCITVLSADTESKYELKIIQAWQNYAHPSDVNNMLLMHFCADILVQLHDISALCCFFPLYKLTFIPNYSNSFPLLLFLKEKERISTKWCNDELYLRFICEFPTLLPFLENKNT